MATPTPQVSITSQAFRQGVIWLILLSLCAVGGMALVPRFEQPDWYHKFAGDHRSFWGIPCAFNVVTNLPFVLVGLAGAWFLLQPQARQRGHVFIETIERYPYLIFFVGIALTGIGSAYYHSEPNNDTLLWDRLPLAMAFMALFAAIVGERLGRRVGTALLIPLVVFGGSSVVYWHWSEVQGIGDLRFYLLVQFYPLLVLPFLLWWFPSRYTRTVDLFSSLAWYVGAKILEIFDKQIYGLGNVISGHTLKHLAAAVSAYFILLMLQRRQPQSMPSQERS